MRNCIIDLNNSTLEDRIKLRRVLESNDEVIYFSRYNIQGIMLSPIWETNRNLCWDRLAFTGKHWDIVNMTFKPNITLNDFVEKYKCLKD